MNPWLHFESLNNKQARTIVEILEVNTAENVSRVRTSQGIVLIAEGAAVEVGQSALMVDGKIEKRAPGLIYYSLEL